MKVQTSRGELSYYRDWDNGGGIVMIEPQTLTEYFKRVNIAQIKKEL